ncbi:GNAT family N-acetyltransferase [Verrucomicrobium sp. BvORR034]|uniref:GNAT family N-acetyltransferase n=1 Tax=Verrucomicrobium sp. BvORR034 TaxID=1396418 RepID=UPI002241028A|nr:GNAT family N-acetyltransferase [Verrucomicrobium sp. BvORR034]
MDLTFHLTGVSSGHCELLSDGSAPVQSDKSLFPIVALCVSRNRAVLLFSALVDPSQTELDLRIPTINDSSLMNVADPKFVWILASQEDINAVQSLMQSFYAEEKLPYDGVTASTALDLLLAGPNLGAIFLLQDPSGSSHGYFVLTIGFSLEFGGRFALLDELFVQPSARGVGAGKSALVAAEAWVALRNIPILRLEVNHHNEKARSIYLNWGFQDDHRNILSKRIASGNE